MRRYVFLLRLTSIAVAIAAPATDSKLFRSSKYRFSVRYPASWYLFDRSARGILEISNFHPSKRVHGVVLPNFGATISVVPAPDTVSNIERWISHDAFDAKVSVRELSQLSRESGACTRLVAAEWRYDVGIEAYFHETNYYCYCQATGALYSVGLLNWADDPNLKQLQAVAEQVARSLRSW